MLDLKRVETAQKGALSNNKGALTLANHARPKMGVPLKQDMLGHSTGEMHPQSAFVCDCELMHIPASAAASVLCDLRTAGLAECELK